MTCLANRAHDGFRVCHVMHCTQVNNTLEDSVKRESVQLTYVARCSQVAYIACCKADAYLQRHIATCIHGDDEVEGGRLRQRLSRLQGIVQRDVEALVALLLQPANDNTNDSAYISMHHVRLCNGMQTRAGALVASAIGNDSLHCGHHNRLAPTHVYIGLRPSMFELTSS